MPAYCMAPSEVARMMGDLSFAAACTAPSIISRLLMLKWPTAYFPREAFWRIVFVSASMMVHLNLKFFHTFFSFALIQQFIFCAKVVYDGRGIDLPQP